MSAHSLPDVCSAASTKTAKRQRTNVLIADTNDNDVLLGRGNHVNKRLGNIRFRRLIQQNKEEYSKSCKHYEKDALARKVCNEVLQKGGRFLRKVPNQSLEDGKVLWETVDATTAMSKIKQAFRDNNAPVPEECHAEGKKPLPYSQQCSHSQKSSMLSNLDRCASRGSVHETILDEHHFANSNLNRSLRMEQQQCANNYPISIQNSRQLSDSSAHDGGKRDSNWLLQGTHPHGNLFVAKPQIAFSVRANNTYVNERGDMPDQFASPSPCQHAMQHNISGNQTTVSTERTSTDSGQHRFLLDQLSEQSHSTLGHSDSLEPFASQFQYDSAKEKAKPADQIVSSLNVTDRIGSYSTNFGSIPMMPTARLNMVSHPGKQNTKSMNIQCSGMMPGTISQPYTSALVNHDQELLSLFSHQRTLMTTNLEPTQNRQHPQTMSFSQAKIQNPSSNFRQGAVTKQDLPEVHDALLGIQQTNHTFPHHQQQLGFMAPMPRQSTDDNNETLEPNPVLLDRVGQELPSLCTSVIQQLQSPQTDGLEKRKATFDQSIHHLNAMALDYFQSDQSTSSTEIISDQAMLRSMSPRPLREESKCVRDGSFLPSSMSQLESESVTFAHRHSLDFSDQPPCSQPQVSHINPHGSG